MEAATAGPGSDTSGKRLLVAGALGALVAVALGVYGNVHDPNPTEDLTFTLFFPTTISMKVWMASAAVAFALIQVASAFWVFGKLPGPLRIGLATCTGSADGWHSSSRCLSLITASGRWVSRTPTRGCWPTRCSAAPSTAPSPPRS